MDFTYENAGTNTYLVYELGAADEIDTMSLGMLTNNDIPGFAEALFQQRDTTKYIKYNVSAKIPVSQMFGGIVNKKRLIGVLAGIVNAMLAAEDYMLERSSILLNLDYIFADVTSCETVVICLPVKRKQWENPDLGTFFKNIIFNTQFDQTENCDHVAQILNYLNSNPVLSLMEFRNLLEELEKPREQGRTAQPQAIQAEPVGQPQAQVPLRTAQPSAPQPTQAAAAVAAHPTPIPRAENLQFGPNYPVGAQQPVRPAPAKPVQPQVQRKPTEKPMTMFYLLQHYSKENAAIYKAQKEEKKAMKAAASAPAQPKKTPPVPRQTNVGFSVPGRPETAGAAFTGQTAPQGTVRDDKVQRPEEKPAVQMPRVQPVTQVPAYQVPARPSTPVNFGETVVLNSGVIGETTVLGTGSAPAQRNPHLVRIKNNENIPINKPVFRIGKERSYVDYFIGDNTAISRSHANIVDNNGEFFIVDTNSTNHTYVNGGMIQSNVQTKLSDGTKIRLANEDFEFRLY